MKSKPRGGAKDGSTRKRPGQPPLSETSRTVKTTVSMTEEDWGKFRRLGGSKWLREQIRMAKGG